MDDRWYYVYFGYTRHGNKGLAKRYLQFWVDGEAEVIFDTYHDFLLDYVESLLAKQLFHYSIVKWLG